MSQMMMNNQSRIPPGFRFHPTEEELLDYYLRKKVAYETIDLDVIPEIDLNKIEPWDIQETCKIGSTPQNDWYFFSHKDKKYPTGSRTNRATAAGFWKATGRDKVIYSSSKRIGMRKTLVFYMGRAPHGLKSDWIMHEYRLEDGTDSSESNACSSTGDSTQEEGWVICRVFRKKNIFKALDNTKNSPMSWDEDTQMPQYSSGDRDGDLDQILQYMRRACKMESDRPNNLSNSSNGNNNSYMNTTQDLTNLAAFYNEEDAIEADASSTHQSSSSSSSNPNSHGVSQNEPGLTNWAAVDRLIASHLNGQSDSFNQLGFFNDPDDDLSLSHLRSSYNRSFNNNSHDYNYDVDLWS